jgi:chemotaxis protein methyltransferase WspC
VLIYFDNLAKDTTIKKLYSLLKGEGLLLVGASETRLIRSCGLDLIRYNCGFAGCKKTKTARVEKPDIISSLRSQQPVNPQPNPGAFSNQTVLVKSNFPISPATNDIEKKVKEPEKYDLETIRNLADQGNLEKAISLCSRYLQQDSTSVEAHVLLGQIYQAQGWETKAENYFQKAIYLDPKNYQALLHLALLKEQSGELVKADILRQRIRRLEKSEN